MAKYRVLVAAMLIQILLGFQYTWAVFARRLEQDYGFTSTRTQMIFAATVIFFSLGFMVAGRIQDRTGPRLTTLIGAALYGGGLVLAGLGGPNFTTLYIGTGALVGLGIAFTYVGPLATPVKWFPMHKGTVTGLVVGAFASGAFFLTALAKLLMALGLSIFDVFIVIGVMGLAGISLLSLCLVVPDAARAAEERKNVRMPPGLLKGGHFWSLVVGIFTGTFAGLAVIGNIESIGVSMGASQPWLGMSVMVLSIGNTIGRFGWGFFFERLGPFRSVVASLMLQTLSIGVLVLGGHAGPAFVLAAFLVGFNYGGCFVVYVAEVAHTYGAHLVGTVYGLMYIIYIVSGLTAPAMMGRTFDAWHTYVPALSVAAIAPFAGAVVFTILYRRPWESGPHGGS